MLRERLLKVGDAELLVGRQEKVFETRARPADRTSFSGKTDSPLSTPQPGEERNLLLLPLYLPSRTHLPHDPIMAMWPNR